MRKKVIYVKKKTCWPLCFFECFQQLMQFVFQVIAAQLEFFVTSYMLKINHIFKCFQVGNVYG